MRHSILTFILTISSWTLFGQSNDTWSAFWNKDTTLIGFKDKSGNIKIEPKFMGATSANKFDCIIAVTEQVNDKWSSYYLTKTGKIVGKDSLHMFDNGSDCESEGFIRFRDRKTDKAGMFNKNGDIVIPALYNDLTRVRNGMIIALQGAEKKYSEGGEHYSWIGGKELLIDTNNKVLIENFKLDNNFNFYSLNISKLPSSDTLRQNFKAVDGQYYSFIDFDKEFKTWLKTNLLDNFTKQNLPSVTYDEVTFWKERGGWTKEQKENFMERNFELIKSKLLELNSDKCEYFISNEGLNPLIYDADRYNDFFNNCGESKDWIYPVKNIVITHKVGNNFPQDHFDFLRTDNGYKLISVTIRTGQIK
ncbi:MAG: WG repeat-containing protein [Chitinophagales bacterium]